MNASRQWLEAFLRHGLDSKDVARRLAMLGAPVDAIEAQGAALDAFVVGLVTEVRQHPDADKLRVTKVDDGSGTVFNVVCGAPNVTAGNRYPFARLGTIMPNGMKIERRKLRGEPSEGMLCSARELGLGDDHDGLLTLNTDAAPGTPLVDVLDAGDERLVIDVTPNRADLLGHKGIARELSASLGIPFRLPDLPNEVVLDLPTPSRFVDEAAVGGIRVAIDDSDGCGRLLAGVIRGVTIGPSPEWLRQRLTSIGLRSINNVVDATNYILHELNQPMHAYDAATLRGPALIARSAVSGETIKTLDGVDRKLPEGMLVIADAARVIGVAGVMGGQDTEVSDATRDILLECAWFNPARVRQSRRSLGITTDAAHRFERGVDRWGAVDAFRRAVRLIITIAGGALDGPLVDCFPVPSHPPRLFLRIARVHQVLGVELPRQEIEKQLVAIGATVVSKPEDGRIAVDVPGWRPDITREIDLIEEVARVYGYDRIAAVLRPFRPGSRRDDRAWSVADQLRTTLVGAGLSEIVALPMVADAGSGAVRVANPLSADHATLRQSLLPSLVRAVELNWSLHLADIRLFEIGTGFSWPAGEAAPHESLRIAFGVTGAAAPAHWTASSGARQWDRWDALGIFQRLVDLAYRSATIQVESGGWVAATKAGLTVGWCGLQQGDAPPWAGELWGGEVSIDVAGPRPAQPFVPLPQYPSITRDVALLVALDAPIVKVLALLRDRGARHGVQAATVIDEYRGKSLPDGKRSVTVRLVFRSSDRTLTDSEVDQAMQRLKQSLERELDVTVRST